MTGLKKSTLFVQVVLLVVPVLWGSNNIVMKIGFRYFSAVQFSGVRMALAFPFMLYLAFFRSPRVPFATRDLLGIIAVGGIGFGIFQILFPLGIDRTSPAIGGILMATMPVDVVILSVATGLERPHLRTFAGVLLTLVGIGLIVFSSTSSDSAYSTTLIGILCMIGAEFGYASNTTFLRPFMNRYPPLQVTGLSMASSVVTYYLVFGREVVSTDFVHVDPRGWVAAIYSGIVALFLSNLIWNKAVARIGSSNVAVYGNLPPFVVVVLSALVFGERLGMVPLLGGVVILFGVVLVQFQVQKQDPS